MTVIEGVDQVVNATSVFDEHEANLAALFARGVRNFVGGLTLTVFGAAVLAGAGAAAVPRAFRGNPSFQEPPPISEDDQWRASVGGLSTLIDKMRSGARPAYAGELSSSATHALASLSAREQGSLDDWAKALASEGGDIDD